MIKYKGKDSTERKGKWREREGRGGILLLREDRPHEKI